MNYLGCDVFIVNLESKRQNRKASPWRPQIKLKLSALGFLFWMSASTIFGQTVEIDAILYSTGKPVVIEISNGKIFRIRENHKASNTTLVIAPGLVELQINGFMGTDYSDQNLTPEAFLKSVQALWQLGVTTILPTVITASHENLLRSFTLLSNACNNDQVALSVPGYHLEGPYISPEKGFRGAHLEKYIRAPDWIEFSALQRASGNRIKVITLAPEIEDASPFIRKCVQEGIIVALGHHNGNADQIDAAVEAGARLSTHLGNGCANMIDRHNNPLWPQLANDSLSVSIIADGFHLNKQEVQTFYKSKGIDKVILVSDALDLAGMPPGEYVRGERNVVLTQDVVKFPEENVLAGAASPINVCVANMVLFTGCALSDAIRMASSNPAKLIGLNDRGEIAVGKRADLILFSMENDKMVIHKTFLAGRLVYEKK